MEPLHITSLHFEVQISSVLLHCSGVKPVLSLGLTLSLVRLLKRFRYTAINASQLNHYTNLYMTKYLLVDLLYQKLSSIH